MASSKQYNRFVRSMPPSDSMSLSIDHSEVDAGSADSIDGASEVLEAKQLRRIPSYSKGVIISLLLILPAVCGAIMYSITSRGEQAMYEQKFARHANEIGEVSEIAFDNILSTLSHMGLTISSYALERNETWPFVTIPSFETKGGALIKTTKAFDVSLNVLVKEKEKALWENYSAANQEWIQTGLDYNQKDQTASPIIPYIHRGDVSLPDEGPADPFYAVTWQIAPAPEKSNRVNYNSMTNEMARSFSKLLQLFPATFSALWDDQHNNEGRPRSHLMYPIYEQVGYSESNQTLVGYIDVVLPWDIYFENILPPNTPPLVVVLSNSCGQAVTLQVRGTEVILISSEADLHDPKFDSWEVNSLFSWGISSHSGDIDAEPESLRRIHCLYSHSIYPTQEFEDVYLTKNPMSLAAGATVLCLFTLALVLAYGNARTKQQKRIEASAEHDNAIITSLYPAQVRERMLKVNDGGGSGNRLGSTKVGFDIDEDGEVEKLLLTKPIADLFPIATVLFADICGFNSWSSERQPEHVFVLLETLFGAFDRIAKKELIFKVETIGDCYVAVTGLPEPREDHAAAMSLFALKCMAKMRVIFDDLVSELGPETANLSMRFGVHSGPVTAGVLRGEKSRFQLFGDTVNTASRIETTCRQGCIHLSASTAKLLISSGKESWVEKREGKVTAKGKGELTTYWLTLAQKADAMKHLVRVRERIGGRGKNVYRNVFVGCEAVDALVYNGLAKSRHDAVELARIMAKGLMLFRNKTGKHTFGDDMHCYRFSGDNDLNSGSGWDIALRSDEEGKRVIESSDILKPSRLLADQAEAFREGVDIRDRKHHMKTLKSCFIGSEAVDVLFFSGIANSRHEAIQIGRKLEKELRWFHSIIGEQPFDDSNNSFYRLRVPFEKRRKSENYVDDSVRSMFSETASIDVDDPESLSPIYSNGDLWAKKKTFIQLVKPLVGYRRVQLGRGHNAVFVGEEAIDVLVYAGFAKTRREAIYYGRLLAKEFNLFYHVSHEHALCDRNFCYRFRDGNETTMVPEDLDNIVEAETCGLGHSDAANEEADVANPVMRGELGEKADRFKRYIDVRDRCILRVGAHRITYKSCFVGSEAVDALVFSEVISTREEAVELGRVLAKELRLFNSVTGSDVFKDEFEYYRFTKDNSSEEEGTTTEIDYLARKVLVEKAEAFLKCLSIKDRYFHFRKYRKCFLGKDTVDAVVNAGVVETRMEAVELARTLARELSLLRHVCGDHAFCDDHLFFRLEDKEIRDAKLREYLGPAEKRRDFETEPISEFQAETTTRKDGKIAAD